MYQIVTNGVPCIFIISLCSPLYKSEKKPQNIIIPSHTSSSEKASELELSETSYLVNCILKPRGNKY